MGWGWRQYAQLSGFKWAAEFGGAVQRLRSAVYGKGYCFAEFLAALMACIVGTWTMAMLPDIVDKRGSGFYWAIERASYPFWLGLALSAIGGFQIVALAAGDIRWRQAGALASFGAWVFLLRLVFIQDPKSIANPMCAALAAAAFWAQFRLEGLARANKQGG